MGLREIILEQKKLKKETIKELASACKTSYATLSRWFKGKPINSDIIEKMLAHYNLMIVKKFEDKQL